MQEKHFLKDVANKVRSNLYTCQCCMKHFFQNSSGAATVKRFNLWEGAGRATNAEIHRWSRQVRVAQIPSIGPKPID